MVVVGSILEVIFSMIDDGLGISVEVGVLEGVGIGGLTVLDMNDGSGWNCIKCFKREWNEKQGHAETRIFIKSLLGKLTQLSQQTLYKIFCFFTSVFFIPPPFKTFLQFQGRRRLL